MAAQIKEDDFSEFYLADTAKLDIELPNGDPMLYKGQQVIVHIWGPSSPQFIKAKTALDRESTKRAVAAMGQKIKNKDREDQDADAKFLIAITEHFENFPYPGGIDAIYREQKLKYIHDQVRVYINDLGNFFETGPTT
jgi:hypothetical protein